MRQSECVTLYTLAARILIPSFWLHFLISGKDDQNASKDCSKAQGFSEYLCNVDDI